MNRLINLLLYFSLSLSVVSLSGCGGGGGGGNDSGDAKSPTINQSPTANAGNSQTITLNAGETSRVVTLSGSGSDPDGSIASYLWSGSPTPSPASAATATVTLAAGTYNFSLITTDNQGSQSAPATVTITVNTAAPTKAVIKFSTTLPIGSTEKIGSVGLVIELPVGVTLSTPVGTIPTGPAGTLNFSGEGARFANLASASAFISGDYTLVAGKANVEINAIFVNTKLGNEMIAGEFATLICSVTPGTTVTEADFKKTFTSVLIGNATGVKLYDTIGGVTGPASASYTVNLQ